MPKNQRCVYALILAAGTLGAASTITPQAEGRPGVGPPAVPIPESGPTQIAGEEQHSPLWWALFRLHVEMLCAILDCYEYMHGSPWADDETSTKEMMRRQVLAYAASGVLPNLTPGMIAEAKKGIAELQEAMASSPPELNPNLKSDYEAMMQGVIADLAGL